MLAKTVLPWTLGAVAVVATSIDDNAAVQFFKRDHVLEPRDIELAESHGVNLTEMYKHSHMKRDGGDNVTVWVHRSFQDAQEESVHPSKRDIRFAVDANRLYSNEGRDRCGAHFRHDRHDGHTPSIDGLKTMRAWAKNATGNFAIPGIVEVNEDVLTYDPNEKGWVNLVVAGTNSGYNALYRARTGLRSGDAGINHGVLVGTDDIHNDVDWSLNRSKEVDGVERVGNTGYEQCFQYPRVPGKRSLLQFWITRTEFSATPSGDEQRVPRGED